MLNFKYQKRIFCILKKNYLLKMNMKKIIHCSFNFSSLRSKTYLNSLPYLE